MEDLGQTTSGMYLVKLTEDEYIWIQNLVREEELRKVYASKLSGAIPKPVELTPHIEYVTTTTQDVTPTPPKRKARTK